MQVYINAPALILYGFHSDGSVTWHRQTDGDFVPVYDVINIKNMKCKESPVSALCYGCGEETSDDVALHKRGRNYTWVKKDDASVFK